MSLTRGRTRRKLFDVLRQGAEWVFEGRQVMHGGRHESISEGGAHSGIGENMAR
jgi:hypothetical protein